MDKGHRCRHLKFKDDIREVNTIERPVLGPHFDDKLAQQEDGL